MGAVQSMVSGDWLYPDNPSREARLTELVSDINRLSAECATAYASVKSAADVIDSKLARYGIPVGGLPSGTGELSPDAPMYPLYSPDHIQAALRIGAVAGDDNKTNELIGEIVSFSFSPILGMILNGSERREKLREGIKECLPARHKLQTAVLVNQKLAECLQATVSALNATLDATQGIIDPEVLK